MAGVGAEAGGGAGERAERARKTYRYVSDIARRIDEAMPACKKTPDLFTTYLEGNRQKLRDNCEKLMFLDPLQYGRKSLELLWRKAYYETVSTAKKIHSKDEKYDEFIFTHIVCGIGHFHHIISRLISETDLKLINLDYPPANWDDDGKEMLKSSIDEDLKQWTSGIIHSCLIYLGDLSRYQSEMFENFDVSIAARYYLQAAYIDLSSGMPYNQLGNLYTDRNHNLDSVCFYIHCLSCSVPFEGAEGNLSRLFEKNSQIIESMPTDEVEALSPIERVRFTISRILMLVENWYMPKENDQKEAIDIGQLCNMTAHDFKVCLSYCPPILPDINKSYDEYLQTKEAELISPSYFNDDVIYNVVLVCLFCIDKLNEIDANKAFAVKAFTLALFSQLLQKFLDRMHQCGFRSPSRNSRRVSHDKEEDKYSTQEDLKESPEEKEQKNGNSEEKVEIVNGHNLDIEENIILNGNGKTSKKMMAKRRRRRRLNSDSSDLSDDEIESSSVDSDISGSENDISDSEESSIYEDSNVELTDDDYDVIVVEEKVEASVKTEKEKVEQKLYKGARGKEEKNSDEVALNEAEIQRFLRGDNFLPSLKLLQDWILTETDLIMSCGESGDELFQSVVDLLNILQSNFRNENENQLKILNFAKSAADKLNLEYKVIPLPEDVHLRGTNICRFDKDATEWKLIKKYNPSVYEESVIRILNFINFGHQIAQIVPRIRYNRSMKIFFMKKSRNAKEGQREPKKKLMRSPVKAKAAARNQPDQPSLMRNLGKLWLQSRVRELESAVRGHGRGALPAYLVVDTDAMTLHTGLVKQLVKLRKFVVLVPTVVLQSIDELKKVQSGARDAIRWLETQLQGGCRFLRTQRPNESKTLPFIKYPRKAPKAVHQFIQIIEFCHHFVNSELNQGGNGDPENTDLKKKNPSMLILLTGSNMIDTEEVKDFSYTGVAQSAGVTVECIVPFMVKWKNLVHKVNRAGKKKSEMAKR